MVVVTTVGPLHPSTRDRLAEFRDKQGHSNYDEAVKALLANAAHREGNV
jgi:hypothetical protein